MDDIHQDNERTLVENYMKQHCIEDLLDETVNCILENRPTNPYCELARLIESKSMPEILEVSVESGFGEKGHCAVNAVVLTNMGVFYGACGLPRKEFEESDEILQDFSSSTEKVDDVLKGCDPCNLREIDTKLTSIPNLDPSICVAVSIACCRAGAKHRGIPLYRYLCDYSLESSDQLRIPVPVVTVAVRSCDGRTGPSKDLLMQDVNVIPTNTYTYSAAIEALRSAMVIVNTHIRKTETQVPLASCAEGSARGASLNVKSDQLEDVVRAVYTSLQSLSSNTNGFKLTLDARCNGFRYTLPGPSTDDKSAVPGTARAPTARSEAAESTSGAAAEEDNTVYYLLGNPSNIQPVVVSPRTAVAKAKAGEPEVPKGPDLPVGTKTSAELLDLYVLLWKQYGLLSIEDPFSGTDVEALKAFKNKIASLTTEYNRGDCPAPLVDAVHDGIGEDVHCNLQIVADESICTLEQLQQQEKDPLYNTLKVSLHKIGSVYQALLLCKRARVHNEWSIIVGCEDEHCVETIDTFIADFAVAVGAGQFASGGLESGEYMAKYARLLEITREDSSISYCGKKFR